MDIAHTYFENRIQQFLRYVIHLNSFKYFRQLSLTEPENEYYNRFFIILNNDSLP